MGRLWRLIYGKFLKLIGIAEAADPQAILETAIESRNKLEVQGREALSLKAGVLERLKGQMEDEHRKLSELEDQITSLIEAGHEDLAKELASEYEQVEREFTNNQEQFDLLESDYKVDTERLNESLKLADKEIQQAKDNIRDTKIHESIAKANAIGAGIRMDTDGVTDSMARIKEITEERKSKAMGKSRVARDAVDFKLEDINRMKKVREATGGQALARFAAKRNMTLKSAPAPTDGPVSTDKPFGTTETDQDTTKSEA